MSLKIYNTLTQKKEEFQSLEPNHIRMYLCGPTVYNFVHVGNFRGPIFFNFVRNYFEFLGSKVTYVYNYTDVDDKIIKAAAEQKITAQELSQKFIIEFEKDFKNVGLKPATVNPRVTDHIEDIIKLIADIIAHGAAYEVDGDVYCSIEKIKNYGKLSHKEIDQLMAGARVEIGEKKKNPLDFALWKKAKKGEPFWQSPWGDGRPGWHIECSAMAKKYLGETFDIHGGGIDLIFPHHENEIAQSESATGKPFARYWMHNNFIIMGKDKMSKSLGNIFTVRQFLERYNGEILKFLILSAHYRSPSDFAEHVINHAMAGLARIYSSLARAEDLLKQCEGKGFKPEKIQPIPLIGLFGSESQDFMAKVKAACDDDFNTPEVMATVFSLVRSFNHGLASSAKISQTLSNTCALFLKQVKEAGALLSLFNQPPQEFLCRLDDLLLREKSLERSQIQTLVDERVHARKAKDFKKSDEIRDKLLGLGIELRDSPEGTQWEVKKT